MAEKKKDKILNNGHQKDASSEIDATSEEQQNKNGVFKGFFEFLKEYSVIGLAIGLVIGGASQNLVKIIVDGVITPFIGLIIGIFLPKLGPLANYEVHFQKQTFMVGNLIQALIQFIIVLFLIYIIIKVLLRRDDLIQKK